MKRQDIITKNNEEQSQSKLWTAGILLLPNSSIERDLVKDTRFFINKAYQQLYTLRDDLYQDSLRFDLKKGYSTVFSPYAEKIADKYAEQQRQYVKFTADKILSSIYRENEQVVVDNDKDRGKTYLLLLALMPFLFDALEKEVQGGKEIERALSIAKEKTFKKIDTVANEANFTDYLGNVTDILIGRGITRAIWHARNMGQHIRPSHHYIMNGQEYDLRTGLFDPDYGDYCQCGELNGCRCIPRIIVRG